MSKIKIKLIFINISILFFTFVLTKFSLGQPVGIIKQGTKISIKAESYFSSNEIGYLKLCVAEDIKNEFGDILIKKGTPVKNICNSTKAKNWGRPGEIIVYIISLQSMDNEEILLIGKKFEFSGIDKTKSATISSCLFFPFTMGIPGFFIRGTDATIPANYLFEDVYVKENVSVFIDN
jgi:hypothetical protein